MQTRAGERADRFGVMSLRLEFGMMGSMTKKIDSQLRAKRMRIVRGRELKCPTLTAVVPVVAGQGGVSRE